MAQLLFWGRKTARRRTHSAPSFSNSYRRRLHCEPLEDRRMLALLTVDTPLDTIDFGDNLLSLREAIFVANTVPGTDTIQFDFGHDGPETILLEHGELAITDSLVIEGLGAELLTIDASGNDDTPDSRPDDEILDDDGDGSRIFRISDGSNSSFIEVTIGGATLTGADARSVGGAIQSYEKLSLESVVLTGNAASAGGAIYNRGELTIVSSTISENVANSGAAIYAVGDLEVVDTSVTGNVSRRFGGGILVAEEGDATFARVLLTGNSFDTPTAFPRDDAVINFNGDNLFINECTITDNQYSSGIVAFGDEVIQIHESMISDHDGLGIQADAPVVSIERTVVSGNGETGIIVGGNEVTIAESTISGNRSLTVGGIRANTEGGSISIEDCAIFENTVEVVASGFGRSDAAGGIRIGESTSPGDGEVKILRSSFYRNAVSSTNGEGYVGAGGGIAIRGNFATTISGSHIYDNSTQGDGGGISLSSGSTLITRTSVTDNQTRSAGGGIYVINGQLELVESAVSGNRGGVGGGISAGATELQVLRSTISGNSAVEFGQFIHGDGGGIWATISPSPFYIADSTIDGNTADSHGGGIFASNAKIVRSTISNNTAETGGGAWLSNATVENSTISQNDAVLAGGIYASNTTVSHSTVASNRASSFGGGIFVAGTNLGLDHTIVATNFGPPGRDLTGLLGSTIDAHYSLIGSNVNLGLTEAPVGSPDANGNLVGGPIHGLINPLFGPLADNGGPTLTHALLPGSPAINAGDPDFAPPPDYDQRGEPFLRVYGGRIDIGAVEWMPEGFLPGDFNGDGKVSAADFTVWRASMGSTTDLQADADGDGDVDENDWLICQAHYGLMVDDVYGGEGSSSELRGASTDFSSIKDSSELVLGEIAAAPRAPRPGFEAVFHELGAFRPVARPVRGAAIRASVSGVEPWDTLLLAQTTSARAVADESWHDEVFVEQEDDADPPEESNIEFQLATF